MHMGISSLYLYICHNWKQSYQDFVEAICSQYPYMGVQSLILTEAPSHFHAILFLAD